MSTSERSYADRLQRGRSLQSAIGGFTPVLAPADASLSPAAFRTFLDGLDTLNTAVAAAESDWLDKAGTRVELVKDIKDRALRASSRVKSNVAWKGKLPQAKTAADNLRGYRTLQPKPPEDGTPAPKTRAQGDQSFGDIKTLLDKLIAALKVIPGYDTGSPEDISTAGLTTLSTQLDGLNMLVAGKEQALAAARTPRKDGYDGENGLATKMKAIKETTKSQYGATSPQHAQVKSIRV